jgi:hypothetical protein
MIEEKLIKLIKIIKKLRIKNKNNQSFKKIYKNNLYNSRYTGIIKDEDYWSDLANFVNLCFIDETKQNHLPTSKHYFKAEKILDSILNKLKVKSVNINGQPNALVTIQLLNSCKKINPRSKQKPLKLSKAEIDKVEKLLYGNKHKKQKNKNDMYKGAGEDFMTQAILLERMCIGKPENSEHIISSRGLKMLKEIIKKLKLKNVNKDGVVGTFNKSIEKHFLKNKNKYCKKYYEDNKRKLEYIKYAF